MCVSVRFQCMICQKFSVNVLYRSIIINFAVCSCKNEAKSVSPCHFGSCVVNRIKLMVTVLIYALCFTIE